MTPASNRGINPEFDDPVGPLETRHSASFVTFQKPCEEALVDLSTAYNKLADQWEVMYAALEQVADCVHVVKPGYDGHPVIVVRKPGTALDEAIRIAKETLSGL